MPRSRLTEATAFVREVRRLLLALTGCISAAGFLLVVIDHLIRLMLTLAGY